MSMRMPAPGTLSASQRQVITDALGGYTDRLMPFTTIVEITPGTPLMQEGVHHDNLYLLISGQLQTTRDVFERTLELGVVSPGQWIGEVCVIDRGPAVATVTANRTSLLLVLSHGKLVALQHQSPEVAGAVLQRVTYALAARLRQSTQIIFQAVNNPESVEPEVDDGGWISRAMGWLLGSETES